jgi:2'-5' RNA ligase
VELLLDSKTEKDVREEWRTLHNAGLPSEQRSVADVNHRPHITLFAGPEIGLEMDRALSAHVSGLELFVQLGALMLFGPHRERLVLVRQVVPSIELLDLQRRVSQVCRAAPAGNFAPGKWSPHVTLARRLDITQLAMVVEALARLPVPGRVQVTQCRLTQCRRWDATARSTWLL